MNVLVELESVENERTLSSSTGEVEFESNDESFMVSKVWEALRTTPPAYNNKVGPTYIYDTPIIEYTQPLFGVI